MHSPDDGEWHGDLRYRLLWSLLAETGMRIGEALSLQHRDWNTGRSSTATVSVVDRHHPYGIATKSGSQRVHIGSRLDRLYADYVWCRRGSTSSLCTQNIRFLAGFPEGLAQFAFQHLARAG